jgi:methylisocitrate lyase
LAQKAGFKALYLSGAAMQIEDQQLPKKCGHLSDKRLVEPAEMAAEIDAARRARSHLRIIARTDAVASEGIEAAVRRARLYLDAGADAIFPEALTNEQMFREFANKIDAPLLANMTEFGKTPNHTAQQFEDFGYKMVIWPVSALRMAARTMEEFYSGLMASGSAAAFIDRMQTRKDLYDLIDYHEYEALDDTIVRSVLPQDDRK